MSKTEAAIPSDKLKEMKHFHTAIYVCIDKYFSFKKNIVAIFNYLQLHPSNTRNKWKSGTEPVGKDHIPLIIEYIKKDIYNYRPNEDNEKILHYTIESIVKKCSMPEDDKKCILSETDFYQFLQNALEISRKYKKSYSKSKKLLFKDDDGLVDYISIEKDAIARVNFENGYGVYIFEEYRERIIQSTKYVDFSNGVYASVDYAGTSLNPVLLKDVYIKQGAYMRNEAQNARRAEQEKVKGKGQGDDVEVYKRLGEYLYTENYMNKKYGICVDLQDQIKINQRIVVLGGPGAGKSTFLRHIANQIVNEKQPDCIPILISLRKYSETKKVVSFKDFVIESEQSDELKEWLKIVLNQSKIIWLLDALDEARMPEQDIKEQIRNLPKEHKVILTSRPLSYHEEYSDNMVCYELAPLPYEDSKAIDGFFRGWYRQTGITNVEERLMWMKDQLTKRPNVEQLIRNPLLLTFLVILSSECNASGFVMEELPYTRSSLYDRFIKFQLTKWEDVKGNTILDEMTTICSKTEANKMAIFGMEEIGWTLHQAYYLSPRQELPTQEYVEEKLSVALLEEMGPPRSKTNALGDLIIRLWISLGIIDVWILEGQNYLCFRHMTIQEYCVAKYLSRMWKSNKTDAIGYIKERHFLREMREPILLFAGLQGNQSTTNEEMVGLLLRDDDESNNSFNIGARLSGEILVETAFSQKWKAELVVNVFEKISLKAYYESDNLELVINLLAQMGRSYEYILKRIQDKAKTKDLEALILIGEIISHEGVNLLTAIANNGNNRRKNRLTRDVALTSLLMNYIDKTIIFLRVNEIKNIEQGHERDFINDLEEFFLEHVICEMWESEKGSWRNILPVMRGASIVSILTSDSWFSITDIQKIVVNMCKEKSAYSAKANVIAYLYHRFNEESNGDMEAFFHMNFSRKLIWLSVEVNNRGYLLMIERYSLSKLINLFITLPRFDGHVETLYNKN